MPNIPAICPECSAVFPMPIYIEDSTINITNFTVTCPRCQKNVVLDGGKYEERENVLRIVDSEDDEFTNNVIAIYNSNLTNEQKLTFIEKIFDEKRGENLEKVVGDKYKKWPTAQKLIFIFWIISGARDFKEDMEFINEIINFILSN